MANSFPVISSDDINHKVGSFSEISYRFINDIVGNAQGRDRATLARVRTAFEEIQTHFSKESAGFTFSPTVKACLSKETEVLEKLTDLADVLQGQSEVFPFGGKCDGAGEQYTLLSPEEAETVRRGLWTQVAKKIKDSISQLKEEIKAPALSTIPSADRRAFEEQAARVRRKLEMRSSREGALEIVRENGLELEFLDDVLKNDPEIVLAAVMQNGLALQYAHERLKNNKNIVIEALRCPHSNSDVVTTYIGEDLKRSPELLEVIAENEMAIAYGDDGLVEDLEFLRKAVSRNPFVLQLLAENLRNHKELVIEALRPLCYQEDSAPAKRFIKEVVGHEIRPFADAFFKIIGSRGLFYSSPRCPTALKEDEYLIAEWIKAGSLYASYEDVRNAIGKEVPQQKRDFAYGLCGVRFDKRYPFDLFKNRVFAQHALEKSRENLERMPDAFAREFLAREPSLLMHASNSLILELINEDPFFLKEVDARWFKNDKVKEKLALLAKVLYEKTKGSEEAFFRLCEQMGKEAATFCRMFFQVSQDPESLAPEFGGYSWIAYRAIEQNPLYFRRVSEELQLQLLKINYKLIFEIDDSLKYEILLKDIMQMSSGEKNS